MWRQDTSKAAAPRAKISRAGLVGRFLEHLTSGGTDVLEDGVDVVDGEDERREQALGEQVFLGADVVVAHRQAADADLLGDDLELGLARRDEGEPAEPLVLPVGVDGEAEDVAVEPQRLSGSST